jgi:hypothetical protein
MPMSNYPEILISLLKRVAVAGSILAIGLIILARAQASGSPIQGMGMGLFGCACIIFGATIIAFPLARLVAEPAGNLFYPGKRSSRKQPMYGIPESKRAKGQYEEAISGFEQIAQEYPEETKPYIEMIDIAIRHLNDPERANAIYRHGIAGLKRDKDRENLAIMYSAIRTRLNSKPSN